MLGFSILPCKLPRPSQTLSFYRFTKIKDPQNFTNKLFNGWGELNCKGRVYVSNEGINAQMSVPLINFKNFIKFTENQKELSEISQDFNLSLYSSESAFDKLHIKVRTEIVSADFPLTETTPPSTSRYVSAEEWNKLLESPSLSLVDVRNAYESEIGYFPGAIKPDVVTFRESLDIIRDMFKGKEKDQLLMYCTGGIRCVKAASYLEQHGFSNIVQLKGGIVNYSKQVKELGIESKFKGKNFVFDGRLAEPVGGEIVSKCHQCGSPSDSHQRCKNERCYHLFIQCQACRDKYKGTCSDDCKEVIELPPEEYQKLLRLPKDGNYAYRVKPRLPYAVQ